MGVGQHHAFNFYIVNGLKPDLLPKNKQKNTNKKKPCSFSPNTNTVGFNKTPSPPFTLRGTPLLILDFAPEITCGQELARLIPPGLIPAGTPLSGLLRRPGLP